MFGRLRRWWDSESANLAIISSGAPVRPTIAPEQSTVTGSDASAVATTEPVPAQIVQNTASIPALAGESAVTGVAATAVSMPTATPPPLQHATANTASIGTILPSVTSDGPAPRPTEVIVPFIELHEPDPEATQPGLPDVSGSPLLTVPSSSDLTLDEIAPQEPDILPPTAKPDTTPAARREGTVVEASLDKIGWRDAGYFTPGAYAGRWNLHRALPRRPATPQLQTPVPVEIVSTRTLGPVNERPKPKTIFEFLAPMMSTTTDGALRIEPESFTEFLLVAEEEASSSAARYWTDEGLKADATAIIDKLLARRENGAPPVTIDQLIAEAPAPTQPATLLLLHNVTRAFSRGSKSLDWRCIDPARGIYRRGGDQIAARAIRRPIFYEIFDPSALGPSDPGDWYRFFAVAAVTGFTASARLSEPPASPTATPASCVTLTASIASVLAGAAPTPQSAAFAWANALHFWETGLYETSAEDAGRTARQALKAFRIGLDIAGVPASGMWNWKITHPATVAEDAATVDVAKATLETEELVLA
jgi:hypothetical protein